MPDPGLKVVIACPTMGSVKRGYETFADGLFRSLSEMSGVSVVMLQGTQPAKGTGDRRKVSALHANRRAARVLGTVTRTSPRTVERLTFAVASLMHLHRLRPDVVLCSEREVCSVLRRVGGWLGLGYAVVLNNGALHRPPFRHVDVVKHSAPRSMVLAISQGEDPARHVLLEEGIDLPAPDRVGKADCRSRLGLSADGFVVLSVGLLDVDYFKRMGYVASEVALFADRSGVDVFLLLVGQRDDQTEELERQLQVLLPGRHSVTTVDPDEMETYYEAADVLVSASQREGFGRAVVEAMGFGLPVVVHDDDVMRWVVGENGRRVDTSVSGAVAAALTEVKDGQVPVHREEIALRYGWPTLGPRYLAMLEEVVDRRRRAP